MVSRKLEQGNIVEGPFWPERVKIISCREVGTFIEIFGGGLKIGHFYPRILTKDDLDKVKWIEIKERDFSCDPEAFFLIAEGRRIRLTHQFDPLYAVNFLKSILYHIK